MTIIILPTPVSASGNVKFRRHQSSNQSNLRGTNTCLTTQIQLQMPPDWVFFETVLLHNCIKNIESLINRNSGHTELTLFRVTQSQLVPERTSAQLCFSTKLTLQLFIFSGVLSTLKFICKCCILTTSSTEIRCLIYIRHSEHSFANATPASRHFNLTRPKDQKHGIQQGASRKFCAKDKPTVGLQISVRLSRIYISSTRLHQPSFESIEQIFQKPNSVANGRSLSLSDDFFRWPDASFICTILVHFRSVYTVNTPASVHLKHQYGARLNWDGHLLKSIDGPNDKLWSDGQLSLTAHFIQIGNRQFRQRLFVQEHRIELQKNVNSCSHWLPNIQIVVLVHIHLPRILITRYRYV